MVTSLLLVTNIDMMHKILSVCNYNPSSDALVMHFNLQATTAVFLFDYISYFLCQLYIQCMLPKAEQFRLRFHVIYVRGNYC